jgi:hypothetical protein
MLIKEPIGPAIEATIGIDRGTGRVDSVMIPFEIVEGRILGIKDTIPHVDARTVHEMVAMGFNNHLHTRRCGPRSKLTQPRLTTWVHVGLRVFDHHKRARAGKQKGQYHRQDVTKSKADVCGAEQSGFYVSSAVKGKTSRCGISSSERLYRKMGARADLL